MVADGYKDTKIGLIPIEWEVVKIVEVLDLMTDYVANGSFASLKENTTVYDSKEYAYYVRLFDLRRGLGHQAQKYVDKATYNFLDKSLLEGNEILIANIGANVGESFLMPTLDMPSTLAPNMIELKLNYEKMTPIFCFHYLKSDIGLSELNKVIEGSGQPKINKTKLKTIKIPLPPLKEQEKIADILSTADDKIDAIAVQIEKAETLKKGLLQKLLSEGIGHSEFKDSELGKIPESWEVVELGSFSKSISKKNKDNVITDVVSVTKYDGIVNSLEYFNKKVFSDNITTYKIIERNQFAYATIHLDEGSVGFLDIFDIAVLSPMYSVFEIDYKRVDRSYFYSLVKSHKMIKIYEHIGLGSVERRKSISFNIFKKIKIPLPPLEEQKQIAEILSTADEKLEVLRAKKENYEILKKGLLQKLLSGEVRI